MAKFEFTIPQNVQAGVSNNATTVTADRGLGRTAKQRVLVATFGDGYEQRVGDGVNIKEETFSIAFNNRPASEINLIAAFFDVKAGTAFDFAVSDHTSTNTTIKVVCDDYSITYNQETIHSLTATFRRVYEP